jgi:hypothetical protein
MKHILSALLGVFFAARLLAQVDVRVSLTQEQFLPGESIEAAVRIANFTGQKLTFGNRTDWIRFNVESTDGRIVNRISEVQESGEFQLESSTRGTIRYDIQPHFDLSTPGRYRISATVQLAEDQEYTSPAVHFEVFRGTRLWEREIGIETADVSTSNRRKYILQQATHLRNVRLYIRVTDDSEAATFKVIPIGPTVSFGRPSCAVDRKSRLHVLHQISADTYRFHLVTPEGRVETRRIYAFSDRRPQLRVNEAGEVAVIGGERRRASDDIPQETVPAPTSAKPDDEPPAKPTPAAAK